MKNTLRSIIALAIVISGVTIVAHAQTSIGDNTLVRSALDKMFEELDKSKVPSGLLLDYGIDIVDLNIYNGEELTDSNYVTPQIFEDIIYSLKSSAINQSIFSNIHTTLERFRTPQIINNNINMAFALYKYNFIKSNALEDGLILYNSTSEKVSDVFQNGTWVNPYDEAFTFASAPSSTICRLGEVKFQFSQNFKFNNHSFSIIQFDPGDGNGYRNISPTSSIRVNYQSSGYKEIKLRARLTSGKELVSHSKIYILAADDIPPTINSSYELPTGSFEKSLDYNGVNVSATVTYYSASHSNELIKPFIVVEGFDPLALYDILAADISSTETDANLGFTNHRNFYKVFSQESNLKDEYDLVFIDWNNSTEDIRANAELLKLIIQEINLLKERAGSTNKNIILGQSMGGLVARYALRTMENANINHEVKTFISHDSPHLGANVPLGLLYFIPQISSFMHGYETFVDIISKGAATEFEQKLYSVLHSTAAKQMLVNYVNQEGVIDNSIHNSWQMELNQLGFPKGDFGQEIENLSIVNGRSFEHNLIYNHHMFYFDGSAKSSIGLDFLTHIIASVLDDSMRSILNDLDFSILANTIEHLGSSKFNIHAEINPLSQVNAGSKIAELEATYTKKYLWIYPKTYNIFSSTKYAPHSGLFYDDYPGSKYSIAESLYHEQFEGSNFLGSYRLDIGYTNHIMFIPTASALAIKGEQCKEMFTRLLHI